LLIIVTISMGNAPSHTLKENSIGLVRGGMPNGGGYGYILQTAFTFLREKIRSDRISNEIHIFNCPFSEALATSVNHKNWGEIDRKLT